MAESASHHQIQFKLKFQKYLTSSKSLLCTFGCWFSTPTTRRWSFCDKIKSIIFWLRPKIMGPTQQHFESNRLTESWAGSERRWFFNPRIERLLGMMRQQQRHIPHPAPGVDNYRQNANYLDIPESHQSNTLKSIKTCDISKIWQKISPSSCILGLTSLYNVIVGWQNFSIPLNFMKSLKMSCFE